MSGYRYVDKVKNDVEEEGAGIILEQHYRAWGPSDHHGTTLQRKMAFGSSWNNNAKEDGAGWKSVVWGTINASSCNNTLDSNWIIPLSFLKSNTVGIIPLESKLLLHDDAWRVPWRALFLLEWSSLFHDDPSALFLPTPSSTVLFHDDPNVLFLPAPSSSTVFFHDDSSSLFLLEPFLFLYHSRPDRHGASTWGIYWFPLFLDMDLFLDIEYTFSGMVIWDHITKQYYG